MYHGGLNRAIGQYNQVRSEASVLDADAHGLVAMLFDAAMEKIVAARLHMERGEIEAKGRCIGTASAIIMSLRSSLNHEAGGEIAANLDALYGYANERLTLANLRNDAAILTEVLDLLRPLREGWNAIPPEVRSNPMGQARARAAM